jgi:hypothetical protein
VVGTCRCCAVEVAQIVHVAHLQQQGDRDHTVANFVLGLGLVQQPDAVVTSWDKYYQQNITCYIEIS